jgi:phage portal protein BeeE
MSWRGFLGLPESRATMTQRDLSLVEVLGGDQTFGQRVNATRLEWLSAATAAIDAISGTLATLPAYVYVKTAKGREEDGEHPLARIVRDGANAHQTWPDFLQWKAAQCLRYGNALAELIHDGSGLAELRPMPWERVNAKILPNGRLVYDFTDPQTMQRRRLLDSEVTHLELLVQPPRFSFATQNCCTDISHRTAPRSFCGHVSIPQIASALFYRCPKDLLQPALDGPRPQAFGR